MSYTVLARRYRSRDFDEIVGQQPIVRTLTNAIEQDRTAHAYLFSGTRGVGKTSMARIMAKALNATEELTEREQVAGAILRGEDLDVIEIDGASNRRVEEARDLIAGAGLSPTRSPYKIYIIDEVHMLTKEAFNTLLKTMEEPPAHVKFILCTTEPQKVPATIQSRCQRFDFRPLSINEIAGQLQMILKQEKIEASDDVVRQVARLGNGSMRDALSLLDRLLATGESPLTLNTIEQMLGLPDQAMVMQLIGAFADSDAAQSLKVGNDLLMRGSTEDQVLEMLAQQFRNLLVLNTCGAESELSDLQEESRDVATKLAEQFDTPGLVHLIALCDSSARGARGSSNARALFDAVLVRLALAEQFANVAALLDGKVTLAQSPGSSGAASSSKKKDKPAPRDEIATEVRSVQPTSSATQGSPPKSIETYVEPKSRSGVPAVDDVPVNGVALWSQVTDGDLKPAERRKIDLLEFQSLDGRTMRLSIRKQGQDQAKFLQAQAPVICDIIQRITGQRLQVQISMPQGREMTQSGVEEVIVQPPDDPLVAEAMDLFDAVVVNVAPLGDPKANANE